MAEKKQNYTENKNDVKNYNKQWNKRNRKKLTDKEKERRQKDINYKLTCNLRSRLTSAIKNNQKAGSSVRDLGCSISELKMRLERQFEPGMTWENYGSEWHIDHILPLSYFDLTDRMEFLEACNWCNLQPLWAEDNLRKSDNTYSN